MYRVRQIVSVLGVMLLATAVQATDDVPAELPESIRELVCYDRDGRVVEVKSSTILPDVAQSANLDGIPHILINVKRFRALPFKLQIFFFEHECAHHILGHLYDSNLNSETEADCLAIKMGRDRGALKRSDILAVRMHIGPLQGSLRGHLPGPRRFGILIRCFNDGENGENLSDRIRVALEKASRLRKFARRARRP